MTDTDPMISIAKRMEALQAENEQLRKLDGPLTTPTGYSRRMLWRAWEAGRAQVDHADPERDSLQIFNRWLLGPMGEHHPIERAWTEDDEIERKGDKGAIRSLADELHRQRAENEHLRRDADQIVELTTLLAKNQAEYDLQLQAMRACIVYARDRRGGAFDFDEWNKMVEYALRAGFPPPHALEDAQTKEAQAWAAVASIREERDELREQLQFWKGQADAAYVEMRDKVRAANQERDELVAAAVNSPLTGVHETAFGKGREQRWKMPPGELSAATEAELDSLYAYARDRLDPNRPREPPVVCACSPKYRELAPGVHAAYCPLAGRPT
jgi:hypothetical protein